MTTAKQVPEEVFAHQCMLGGDDYSLFMTTYFQSLLTDPNMDETKLKVWIQNLQDQYGDAAFALAGDAWCRNHRDKLNIAKLFHVKTSMLEVARLAASKLPDDAGWSHNLVPSPKGFMVFEAPFYSLDVWGRQFNIAAVSWDQEFSQSHGKWVTEFTFYSDNTDPNDFYNQARRRTGRSLSVGKWEPCHITAMADGWALGPNVYNPDGEVVQSYRDLNSRKEFEGEDELLHTQMAESSTNQSRLLYAIFALMQQSIAVTEQITNKQYARQSRGKQRPDSLVTVIQLRRAESHGVSLGTGRFLLYRTPVDAHWRNQPYGDGTIRRIFINAHDRGKNLPYRTTEHHKVSTLAR